MDKNKIQEAAAKFVQKGQYDKAIQEYRRLVEADPKDARTLQKIGELYQKKNDNPHACEYFLKVAECYSSEGFFLKSVAVYKQVLKIDASLIDVNFKLAELYQQLGLMSDAMQQFQFVANHYDQVGDHKASLDTLRRMVDLDPDNVASRIKLAELYARQQMNNEAIAEFKRAAEYLKRTNRVDDYLKVAERLIYLHPQDLALAREISGIYLAKNDTKRALAKLQVCFKANPKDIETLTMLAEAFRALGQTSKTISVYKELAKIYADRGNLDDERRTWRKVLEVAPDDPDAYAKVGAIRQPAPSARAVPVARAPQPAPAPARPAPAPTPHPPAGGAKPKVEHVAKLITETDVYVKYGLHEKALDHLKKIYAIDPDCVEAHEKAHTLYNAAGNHAAAFDELVAIARLCLKKGEVGRGKPYFQKALQQNAAHPEVAALRRSYGGAAPAQAEDVEIGDEAILLEAAEDVGEVAVAEEPADALALDALADEDEVVESAEEEALAAAAAAAEESLAAEEPADEPVIAADEASSLPEPAMDEGLDEPIAPPVAEEESPPFAPDAGFEDATAVVTASQLQALRGLDRPPSRKTEREEIPPGALPARKGAKPPAVVAPSPPAPNKFGPTRAPPAVATAAATELDTAVEELDEAQFFLEQGQIAEARETIETVLTAYPDHRRAQRLLKQLDEVSPKKAAAAKKKPAPAPEPEALADGGDAAFDLARELQDELGEGPAETGAASLAGSDDYQVSVDEVFAEFKKGLKKVLKPEEADAHYDMGMAFNSMSLIDEAMNEFKTAFEASKGKKKEVDCLVMLGLCATDKGKTDQAIAFFKQALASPHATPDASKNLHYELGIAYERAGNAREALGWLGKVQKVDPKYRDVGRIIARVKADGGNGGAAGEDTTIPGSGRGNGALGDNGSGRDDEEAPAPKGTGGKARNVGYV